MNLLKKVFKKRVKLTAVKVTEDVLMTLQISATYGKDVIKKYDEKLKNWEVVHNVDEPGEYVAASSPDVIFIVPREIV